MKTIILLVVIALASLFFFNSITGYFTLDYRPEHCLEGKCVDKSVFFSLPKLTKDFSFAGDIANAPENVWKQPEFYPGFEREGLKYYTNPPNDYLGYFGYGTYPSEEVVTAQLNAYIEKTIYFHTGWYVINFQGLKLIPVIDDRYKDYFDVEIEPDTVLLAPTYPFFDYNWTQKVNFKVKAVNAPKGTYYIGIDIATPSEDFNNKMVSKYGRGYQVGGIFGVGKPFYTLQITVQ